VRHIPGTLKGWNGWNPGQDELTGHEEYGNAYENTFAWAE